MALVNLKGKEIQVKIVYYGPGRAGKTTNLEYLHQNMRGGSKSKFVSLKTTGDRTLFFDFLPIEVGKIGGFNVRIQLYTVPGQIKYSSTRKVVLRGVDGVVFVADLMAVMRKHNMISLRDLHENLKSHNLNIFKIPLVLQYNKTDLADSGIPLLSISDIDKDLNAKLKVPAFEASALKGVNVVNTFRKITELTMHAAQKTIAAGLEGAKKNPT